MENIVGEERHLIAYQEMKSKWYGCLIHKQSYKKSLFKRKGGWMGYKLMSYSRREEGGVRCEV